MTNLQGNLLLIRELLTLRPATRTGADSEIEYDAMWQKPLSEEPAPFLKKGKIVQVTRKERIKSIVEYVGKRIEDMHAKHVLEAGSGRGDIIRELAERYPDRMFYGLELTETGVKHHPSLPNLRVVRGDMRHSGIDSNSIDFIYSHLAIEQLPDEYPAAFSELFRLLRPGGRALFMEEFHEKQSLLQRAYLKRRHLFRASWHELERVGFRMKEVGDLPYQKLRYRTVPVLVEKPQ